MPDTKTGFEIRVNGIPRTFRDRKDMAYDAARLLKSKNPKAIIEVVGISQLACVDQHRNRRSHGWRNLAGASDGRTKKEAAN